MVVLVVGVVFKERGTPVPWSAWFFASSLPWSHSDLRQPKRVQNFAPFAFFLLVLGVVAIVVLASREIVLPSRAALFFVVSSPRDSVASGTQKALNPG